MSIQALYTACTGMNSMQAKLDVIANNLANTETTGFKADRPNFEDLFYHQEKYPGSQDSSGAYTPTGIAIGTGSRLQSTQSNFTQGSLQQTGNQLDVAIQGQGFFQIKDPSGTILLQPGRKLLAKCQRADRHGVGQHRPLAGTGHHDSPRRHERLHQHGRRRFLSNARQARRSQQAGTIQLANFINPQGLLKIGENLYQETDASGTATDRRPGRQRVGNHAARLVGAVQRRSRQFADRSDHDPAGVRDEFADHPGRQRVLADHQQSHQVIDMSESSCMDRSMSGAWPFDAVADLIVGLSLDGGRIRSLPQIAAAAELRLRAQCNPAGPVVTLGDVAEIDSADARQTAALAAIELFPAPTAAEQRIVRVREIQDLLLLRGVNLTEHRFSGSSEVTVQAVVARPASRPASRFRRPRPSGSNAASAKPWSSIFPSTPRRRRPGRSNSTLTDAQARALADPVRPIHVAGGCAPLDRLAKVRSHRRGAEGAGPRDDRGQRPHHCPRGRSPASAGPRRGHP